MDGSKVYAVEKGVPVPDPKRSRKYPLWEMEVGDSFFVPCADSEKKRVGVCLMGSARGKRANGKKYLTRSVDGGVRCWRYE